MSLAAIERSPRWTAALAVSAFALIGTVIPFGPAPHWARVAAWCAVVGITSALAWKRPEGAVVTAGLTGAAAGVVVIGYGGSATLSWFAIILLAAWAAYALPSRVALGFAVLLCLPLAAQWILVQPDSGWGAWIAGTLFTGFACVQDTRQRLLLVQLREAQAGLADRAATEERTRIARELHDVIGHALTVSTLHISSARLALGEDLAEAEKSLAEAERLTQAGLAEVRTAVGMLTGPSSTAPLPGAGEIPQLIESFRAVGSPVESELRGDLGTLTATEGLTIYRILQEALTNAVRHAPGSPVTIQVTVNSRQATLLVDTRARRAVERGAGNGLIGMRERAEALGGTCTAGPHGEGWRVEAVLPR